MGQGDELHYGNSSDLHYEDFGLSWEKIAQLERQNCKLFCGTSSNGTKINMHFVRPLLDGVEVRTRSWTGYGVRDGKVVKTEIPAMNEEKLIKNLVHNITEW